MFFFLSLTVCFICRLFSDLYLFASFYPLVRHVSDMSPVCRCSCQCNMPSSSHPLSWTWAWAVVLVLIYALFSSLSTHFSQSSFLFGPPLAVGSPYLLPFFPLLLFCPLTFSPPPPVSISPPGANPQLCGVLVLLPTWAERLFPPGPLLGANDRPVPGQCQPLPRTKPQQQVGRTRTEWNNDYETWRNLNTSRFQKFGLQSWLF